jgi:hypothetical protein
VICTLGRGTLIKRRFLGMKGWTFLSGHLSEARVLTFPLELGRLHLA